MVAWNFLCDFDLALIFLFYCSVLDWRDRKVDKVSGFMRFRLVCMEERIRIVLDVVLFFYLAL